MMQFVILYATSSGFNDEKVIVGNVKLRVMNVMDKLKDYPITSINLIKFVKQKLYKQYDKDNTIFIINKGCFQYFNSIKDMKKYGYIRYLVSDFIDHAPRMEEISLCDLHIASSVGQYSYFKSLDLNTKHIVHGFDDYFIRPNPQPPNELKIAYVGSSDATSTINFPPNTVKWINTCDWLYDNYWTDDFSLYLSEKDLQLMQERRAGKWMKYMEKYIKPPEEIKHEWKDIVTDYSFHWGIRRYDQYAPFKPFTKGFTSATLKCPILVDHWQYEAKYYLPKDYPFFTDNNHNGSMVKTPAEVLFYVNKIEKMYLSKEWDYALDCMEELYRKCNERKVFKDWVNALDWMKMSLING